MGTNPNGQPTQQPGDVAVFEPSEQLAVLIISWSVIIDHESDSTFEDPDVRSSLAGLSTLILQRLAGTLQRSEPEVE
ncbi:MAG TPA: hypothetical protein VGJ86_23705 [Acidimicrobiales bacterium]|jgi:hypothetical protein